MIRNLFRLDFPVRHSNETDSLTPGPRLEFDKVINLTNDEIGLININQKIAFFGSEIWKFGNLKDEILGGLETGN